MTPARRTATTARSRLCWLATHIPPLVTSVCLALLVVFAFDRRAPVEVESVKFMPVHVQAGTDAEPVVVVKVNRECHGTLNRMLVSQTSGNPTQLYDPLPVVVPVDHGIAAQIMRPLHIPHGFSHGEAVFRSWIDFHCNPINEWWPITVRAPDAQVVIDAPK